MRVSGSRRGVVLVGAYVLLYLPALCVAAQGPSEIRLSEAVIRKRAVKVVMPVFPEASKNRGTTGVAVAEIEIDRTGTVSRVEVLEAPDSDIKSAVAGAVKQWRFKPATLSGTAVKVLGKLTFYYTADHGKSVVRNPEDVPRQQ